MKRVTTVLSVWTVIALFGGATLGRSEEPAAVGTPPATASTSTTAEGSAINNRPTIQQDGLTFVLAHSTRSDSVETEEYFLEKESPESWSQMLTYQRVMLPEPLASDHYVSWLKQHLEQSPGGPRLRIVQQGKNASIFGIHYGKTANAGEQFGLALITTADPRRPNELHLIQYTINTGRIPVNEMEVLVKRWQARFQSQAASLIR